jgi:hypothetical protein
MLLMRANPLLGLGPVNLNFLGPQMALVCLDAISQGPKKSLFAGSIPLPLALVMDLLASKALLTGPYKS